MQNIKKLESLIYKLTNQSLSQLPQQLLQQLLQLINSRVDMPKYVITFISKRMVLKNTRVLINIFTLLEYLAYECELSLYSQISTKEFLFRISGLLMNKEITQEVKDKIMETIVCWEELFRPHDDLLPMFFQFYAGLLRNGFDIPNDYKSKYRTSKPRHYKKPEPQRPTRTSTSDRNDRIPINQHQSPPPSSSQLKTFEQIREQLILTNQIIDNSNPASNIKQNGLLLQMIQHLKQCQKKINKTINENPSQKIMELALASNDDIYITYRRYKDLQRNKKPEPFILTELVSDLYKEQQTKKIKNTIDSFISKKPVQKKQSKQSRQSKQIPIKVQKKIQKKQSTKKQQEVNLLNLESQPSIIKTKSIKKQENLLDLYFQSGNKTINNNTNNFIDLSKNNQPGYPTSYIYQQQQQSLIQPQIQIQSQNQYQLPSQNLLGFNFMQQSTQPIQSLSQINSIRPIIPIQPIQSNISPQNPQLNLPNATNFESLIFTTKQYPQIPESTTSKYGITLDVNDFKTQTDIKNYNNPNPIDRLEELTYQFLKK